MFQAELVPLLSKLNITGTVLVQAAATHAETLFLLHLAKQYSFILGVVGWVDMTAENAADKIAELSLNKKFCGIRPMIQDIVIESWSHDIKILASYPNVYCKLSGLLNEAEPDASWESIKPYVDCLFESFGSQRMMWGSDFPVLNLVSDYQKWFEMCKSYILKCHPEGYREVFGRAAARFYQLECRSTDKLT